MSSHYDKMKAQLKGIKSAYELDASQIVEETIKSGLSGLKSRIKNVEVKTEEVKPTPDEKPPAKFTPLQIADRATATYKEKIRPEVEKPDAEPAPSTHASRTNMKAMAKALTGMRGSGNAGKLTQNTPNGNGDLGQYTSPANNNDGDLGNNTAYGQYYSLTTSMTLEEYERHISEKFGGDEETAPVAPLTCGVCASDPCECETEEYNNPIDDVKDLLSELTEYSWQSVDTVMRTVARAYDVTPKQLHKQFKFEEGVIPDEWYKENRDVQLFGFMPLDEATSIMKVGQVYDVSCLWRGNTMRLKFFWPEAGLCSKEQCQKACDMFYPGSRLLAHYPCRDEPDNYMVIVPPIKESCEFVSEDSWMELDEETNDLFHQICEEVGEPLTSPVETKSGMMKVICESHETGEHIDVLFENKSGDSSLHDWFNKSKSSDGTKGWVQLGGKYAGKPCAKQPGQTTKPKCGSSKMKKDLNKKEEEKAFRRKNREDGNPDRKGKAKNVATEGYVYEAKGMEGMTQKGGHKRSTESGAGLTQKGVEKYRRQNPGSKLQTAVTTPPSKLKPGSKAAGRRKSFCARSRGWTGERGKAARRRWNC